MLTSNEFLKRVNNVFNNEYELVPGKFYRGWENPMTLKHIPCGTTITKQMAKNFQIIGRRCEYCRTHDQKQINDRVKKYKGTCLEKYGVENAMQDESIKQKYKETCLEKYGVENAMQDEFIKQKARDEIFRKYGTVNPIKEDKDFRKKWLQSRWGSTSDIEFKFRNKETLREAILDLTKKLGHKPYLEEIVVASGLANSSTLYNFYDLHKHSDLYQYLTGESKAEKEIIEFVSQFVKIENHEKNILNGKHIDIYIPSLKIGIEYNGYYWHSSSLHSINGNPKPIDYHYNKTHLANSKGIHLIHIWEFEYLQNPDLVKEKLLFNLDIIKNPSFIDLSQKEIEIDLCWYNPFIDFLAQQGYKLKKEIPYDYFYYNQKLKKIFSKNELNINETEKDKNIFKIYDVGKRIYTKIK